MKCERFHVMNHNLLHDLLLRMCCGFNIIKNVLFSVKTAALSAKDGSIQESQVTQSNAGVDSGETFELPEDMDGMNFFIVN